MRVSLFATGGYRSGDRQNQKDFSAHAGVQRRCNFMGHFNYSSNVAYYNLWMQSPAAYTGVRVSEENPQLARELQYRALSSAERIKNTLPRPIYKLNNRLLLSISEILIALIDVLSPQNLNKKTSVYCLRQLVQDM